MSFIKAVIQENENVTIAKFNGKDIEVTGTDSDEYTPRICFLDLETTGLNKQQDQIIEIALKIVSANKKSGEIVEITNVYESFNDPGIPISDEASLVNGITNDMVAGKSIDWHNVGLLFETSDLIVAHNASFDRAFMDKSLPLSQEKLWACTMNDIDWLNRGFTSSKQELLCIWHGFYYDSHRAMNDVDALIHLITSDFYNGNKPILELMENAANPYYKISALNSPFESKDQLKARNYYWNNTKRYWWKNVDHEEIDSERKWLTENIYNGQFAGRIEELPIIEKYKD